MINILSFGGGVNTVALLLYCINNSNNNNNNGNDLKLDSVIFADTGGEFPDTYEYIARYIMPLCENNNIPFITVKKQPTLYDYCYERKILPSRRLRWCTEKWKIKPIHKAIYERAKSNNTKSVNMLLGIAYDEIERINDNRIRKYNKTLQINVCYPLVDLKWKREDCINYITKCGYPIPVKSGCYFCPFTNSRGWIRLKNNYPTLFEKALALENNCARKDFTLTYSKKGLSEVLAQTSIDTFLVDNDVEEEEEENNDCGGFCFI